MLRGSGLVAAGDLRIMLRSRETILWVFVMPVVFFYFIGTVTGGYGRRSSDRPDPLAVVAPGSGGAVLDRLLQSLTAQHFEVRRVTTEAEAAEAIRVLSVPVPADGRSFTDAALAGVQQRLTFRTNASGEAAQFERVRVARAVYTTVADLAVLASRALPADAAGFGAIDSVERTLTVDVESAGHRREAPSGFEQAIPGTLVMFTMLVCLTSGAILLVIERRLGLLRRLATAPLSPAAVVAGKWLGRLVLALVQIAFAMGTGTVLFHMRWGDSLPMIFVLLAAWAAFNASLALVLGSLARTEGQTIGAGVLTSMAMGALGGCWWPIEIVPSWMQRLALLLPTGWTMDAMHKLVSFGDPWTAAIPHVVVLTTGALVLGAIATKVFRFQ